MKFTEIITIILLSVSFISCSITSAGKYSDLLEKYSEGDLADTSAVTEAILEGFSSGSVTSGNLFIGKSAVINGAGSDLSLIYPEEIKLSADKIISDNILYADAGKNRIVLGNSKGFCLFDMDGDPLSVYRADKNESIDSAAARGDNAVFLTGGTIQELTGSEKTVRKIDPGVYNPPYKKLFRSSMMSTEKYYVLITGIAGSYYISIFDAAAGSSIVKNIASSSFEFSVKEDYLLYIRGGTGTWSVVKFDIPGKKRNELKTLGKISDIFLAEEGFVYLSDQRIYIENLTGEKWEAPAELDIKGICRNSVLADYKGKTYIIDFNVLFDRVKEFNQVKAKKNS